MDLFESIAILIAGIAAGAINTVAGSGTLITFPTLIAFGFPPVTATMSNVIGLLPGNLAGTWGYRKELTGQGRRLRWQIPASAVGTITGAWLLLHLPEDTVKRVVPILLGGSLLLVAAQPHIQAWAARRRRKRGDEQISTSRMITLTLATYLTGIYGGYFGAAQGIMLIAIMGVLLPETLQRINGAKNVLTLLVNVIAAGTYILVAHDRINWTIAGIISIGTLIGGYLGGRYGRRLPTGALRIIIVTFGAVATWRLLTI